MFRYALALATAIALTVTVASSASARDVFIEKKVFSNGFRKCVVVKKTVIGDFGDRITQSVKRCKSAFDI
jgi:hypothetical protein